MKKKICSIKLLVCAILFFSCKKIEENITSSSIHNDVFRSQNVPPSSPIITPTVYFIEQFENSSRTEFYSLTNLQLNNPALALLHAGHRSEMPGYFQKNNWFLDLKNQEIVYFSNYVTNKSYHEYYEKYKLSTIGMPPISMYWGGQDDNEKKYLGRGWAKFDAKNNKLYYMARTKPLPYPGNSNVFDQIRSADPDGANDKVVFEKPGAAWFAMDIDFANGRIYYTNFDNNSISVVGTNGKGNKIIVSNAGFGNSPYRRNIKVDPSDSQLYWIMDNTQKQQCAIMSASTSGDNVSTIWETGYQDIAYGLDFDVDAINKKIYFCIDKLVTNKGFASYLIRIDQDGKNAKVIYKPLGSITKIIIGSISN